MVLDPEIGGQVRSTDAVGVVKELFTYVRAHGRGRLGKPVAVEDSDVRAEQFDGAQGGGRVGQACRRAGSCGRR